MKLTSLAVSAFAMAMTVGSGAAVAQYEAPPQHRFWQTQNESQSQYRDREDYDGVDHDGWNREEGESGRFWQKGYRDGFEGARKDFENHRAPTPQNRDEYRDPDDVPRAAIRQYRIAFRQGYFRAVREIQEQGYNR